MLERKDNIHARQNSAGYRRGHETAGNGDGGRSGSIKERCAVLLKIKKGDDSE